MSDLWDDAYSNPTVQPQARDSLSTFTKTAESASSRINRVMSGEETKEPEEIKDWDGLNADIMSRQGPEPLLVEPEVAPEEMGYRAFRQRQDVIQGIRKTPEHGETGVELMYAATQAYGKSFREYMANPFVQKKIQESENRGDTEAMYANMFHIIETTGMPPEYVRSRYEQIADKYFGKGGSERSRAQMVSDAWKAGWGTVNLGHYNWEKITGVLSDEDAEKLEDIKQLMPDAGIDHSKVPMAIVQSVAKQLPITLDSFRAYYEMPKQEIERLIEEKDFKTLAFKTIEASTALVDPISTAIKMMESVIGAPFNYLSQMTGGLLYDRIKSVKNDDGEEIDDKYAIPVALAGGRISGTLEQSEVLTAFLGAPLARTFLGKAMPRLGSALMGTSLARRAAVKGLGVAGASIMTEELQEFAQLGVEMIAVEIAKGISPDHKAFDGSSMTRDELSKEIQATALETLFVSAVFSFLPSTVVAQNYRSEVNASVRAAVRESIAAAFSTDGYSVKEINDNLMDNEYIQMLSDRRVEKILLDNTPKIERLLSSTFDPENIDINLSEEYDKEVEKAYTDYVIDFPEDSEKAMATLGEFRMAYLAKMDLAVPASAFSDEQIANMYSERRAEFNKRKKEGNLIEGETLPSLTEYKDSIVNAAELYTELSRPDEAPIALSKLEDSYSALETFSKTAPSDMQKVVDTMLKDMRESLDSARAAVKGLTVDGEGPTIYRGPAEFTTKDVELVNNKKIESIRTQIDKLKADKKKESPPAIEAVVTQRIAELEQRIVEIERKSVNFEGVLKKQYKNLQKAKGYMDAAMERAASLNVLIGQREAPGYQEFMSGFGATLAMDELERARGNDGVIDLSKVPYDLIGFLNMNEDNKARFTKEHARHIWGAAMDAANMDLRKKMTISRAQKAFQNEQKRRVESLFTQINAPIGNISPQRQGQIKTIRELLGIKTSENIDYDVITESIKEVSKLSGSRVAHPDSIRTHNRLKSLYRNLLEMPTQSGKKYWQDLISPLVESIEAGEGEKAWVARGIERFGKDWNALEVPKSKSVEEWAKLRNRAMGITATAMDKFSIQDMTAQAFQAEIDSIISEYSEKQPDGKDPVKRSIQTLEEAKQTIDYIRHMGALEMEAKGDSINAVVTAGVSAVEEKQQYTEPAFGIAEDTQEASKIKKTSKGVSGTLKHPSVVFRQLGGEMLENIFVAEKLYTKNEEMKSLKRRSEAMDSVMKKLGVQKKEMSQRVQIYGENVQIQELMGVYLAMKDEKTRTAVIDYNTLPLEVAEHVEDYIDDKYIKLADEIGKDFLASWDRASAVHMAVTGQPLGKVTHYMPIMRMYLESTKILDEIYDNVFFGDDKHEAIVNDSFTKKRGVVKTAPGDFRKIRVDLFDMWTDTMHKQEHYIAAAEKAAAMKQILDKTKVPIQKKLGSSVLRQANDYVEHYLNPASIHGSGVIDRMARTLRGNITFSHLALAPSIVLRQGLSGPLYMMYVKPSNYFASVGWFLSNPVKAMNWMKEVAPAVVASGVGFDLINTRVESASGAALVKRKIQDAGMGGITFVDRITKAIGFHSVYMQDVENVGEAQAIQNAIRVTDLTQPTSDRTALPDAYRHGSVLDWMMMYTQQPLKILNMMTYEMGQKAMDVRHDKYAVANMIYGSIALLSSMTAIWILKNRRLPDDPEDVKNILLAGTLGNIPSFGQQFMSSVDKRYSGPSGVYDSVRGLGKLVGNAPAKDKLNALIFDVLPAPTGVIPGNTLNNILDYADSGAIEELFLGGEWED